MTSRASYLNLRGMCRDGRHNPNYLVVKIEEEDREGVTFARANVRCGQCGMVNQGQWRKDGV